MSKDDIEVLSEEEPKKEEKQKEKSIVEKKKHPVFMTTIMILLLFAFTGIGFAVGSMYTIGDTKIGIIKNCKSIETASKENEIDKKTQETTENNTEKNTRVCSGVYEGTAGVVWEANEARKLVNGIMKITLNEDGTFQIERLYSNGNPIDILAGKYVIHEDVALLKLQPLRHTSAGEPTEEDLKYSVMGYLNVASDCSYVSASTGLLEFLNQNFKFEKSN